MAIETINLDDVVETLGKLIIYEEMPKDKLVDYLFEEERRQLKLKDADISVFACERLDEWPFETLNSRMGKYAGEDKYSIFISPKDMSDLDPLKVHRVIRHELHHIKWAKRIYAIPLLPNRAKYALALAFFHPFGELLADIYANPPRMKD